MVGGTRGVVVPRVVRCWVPHRGMGPGHLQEGPKPQIWENQGKLGNHGILRKSWNSEKFTENHEIY